eukprot:TRINITY_DN2799_c0_g1_i10.p1 TRINITY_DN2799_c0_g1~~TRINITY_DN2799_c0_g1_i10.p1  ORF type:complete len:539 (-),score=196.61 TRINITY_DN2799_c0_g1_i10:349-1965(-)
MSTSDKARLFGNKFTTGADIMADGTEDHKGDVARLQSFIGAIAIADLVKSTMGPMGMDKILLSTTGKEMKVTNDGATILKSVVVDNPAANVLINMSKVQDEEVGDGTTSVTVLAGEFLREAEKLINAKIHPQTIIAGFRQATEVAKKRLIDMAMDNSKDTAKFRADLINIAKTTLSSKVVQHDREFFAELCVDAVLRLDGSTNLDQIQIVKKAGGTLHDSYLEQGFILDKKIGVGQPKRIENAKIMVANTAMDADKIKIFGARVRVNSIGEVAKLEAAEKAKMKAKCDSILESGLSVFINRQLIYNYPEQQFADAGVMAIEHADFDGIERLASCLDAEIASTFTDPKGIKLGTCELVEEVMIGEDRVLRFSGVAKGAACTMVLRGANGALLDEAERSIHDALCVLMTTVREHRSVYGGGACEISMAQAVEASAADIAGKAALAMKGFAVALRAIPHAVADNGGYDSAAMVTILESEHAKGNYQMGLDMLNGVVGDMAELGIMESFRSKEQSLLSAAEAAEMIIRVDNIVKAAPRQRQQ